MFLRYLCDKRTSIKTFQAHKVIGRYVVYDNMKTEDVLRIVTSKGTKMKMAMKWHVLNMVKGVLGSSYDINKAKVLKL